MKHLLLLIAFLCFGWLGASKSSSEKISDQEIKGLISKANSEISPKNLNLGALLAQLGVQYYAPTAKNFLTEASSMVEKIGTYCDILSSSSVDAEFTSDLKYEARQAWTETMGAYHKMSTAPFGPIYSNSRELANNIYSWPLAYECGMHMEMLAVKSSGQLDASSLYTSKGMMAVEFGLFKDLDSTDCNQRNKRFQKVHEWLRLSTAEKTKDMCNLALAAANDVLDQAHTLNQAWDVAGSNYTAKMIDGSNFESFKSVLNEITDQFFTMLENAKDVQLGKPLGLHKDCLDQSGKCVENIEHKWSQTGLNALKMQFLGFSQILDQGGLGAYLTNQGFKDIYVDLSNQTDELTKYVDKVSQFGTLNELVSAAPVKECEDSTDKNELVPVCTLQRKIRKLTQTIRADFFPALQLNAPLVYQGDAD